MANGQRGRFHGVLEIVRYNWPQYMVGFGTATVALLGGGMLIGWGVWPVVGWMMAAGGVAALWFVLASLAASWWIYDLSGLRNWGWLHDLAGKGSAWAVVHTGLDECGYLFRQQLAPSMGVVLDTFDNGTMTEPSVRRAREHTSTERRADAACKWDAWPVVSGAFDQIYFIFAAHELRGQTERLALFREAARSLSPGGRLVIVEHARDVWNFLVFGPGFLHFWPARVWDDAAMAAGLSTVYSGRKTRFVVVKIYERGRRNAH